MNNLNKNTKFVLYSLLSLSLFSAGALEVRSEVRKLSFTPAYPTGTLNVVIGNPTSSRCVPTAKAQGEVTLNVPPKGFVQLDLNPRCIEAPDKLKSIPTDGIDGVRIAYMSMDENELVVNKAIAALPPFKKAVSLCCFRTDVTDAGILSFKSLNKLNDLDCFMCFLDGSFLKEAKQLKNLEHISVSHNSLKSEHLKHLQELPKLIELNAQETNLNDEALAEICKAKSLRFLSIASNSRLSARALSGLSQLSSVEALNLGFLKNCTDEIIPALRKLTLLNTLDLTRTNVTMTGLEKLKGLDLYRLMIPESIKVGEMEKLQKIFPHARISRGKKISEEIKVQFAPLK